MSIRNCRRHPKSLGITEGPKTEQILETGWVGLDSSGQMVFRPTRGSQGWALYSSFEKMKYYTGLTCGMKVFLSIEPREVYSDSP